MKVATMLNQPAMMSVARSFSPTLKRNFGTANCAAAKAMKKDCMHCAFGASGEQDSTEPGSQTTFIGSNTAWLRGRSGHTKVRNSMASIPFREASTVLFDRL